MLVSTLVLETLNAHFVLVFSRNQLIVRIKRGEFDTEVQRHWHYVSTTVDLCFKWLNIGVALAIYFYIQYKDSATCLKPGGKLDTEHRWLIALICMHLVKTIVFIIWNRLTTDVIDPAVLTH